MNSLEWAAALLGVHVERTKRAVVVIAALAVGAVTATTGIIGFVGLIAPHWVRLMAGPDHRVVLPGGKALPALAPADPALYTWLRDAHGVLGYAFFALILVHIAGALYHAWVRSDGVFEAMARGPR